MRCGIEKSNPCYRSLMTRDEKWLLDEKYGGNETTEYENDRKRLAAGEPLAYVIGWQPFLGLKIFLDSHPLIPRPETEWWTEQLLKEANSGNESFSFPERTERDGVSKSKFSAENYVVPKMKGRVAALTFLDLCAGSGAVGCAALARLPDAKVYFGEIDPAHEATIRKNIRENNLDASRADICIGDLFEPFGDMKFDVIASNPPYVPTGRALPLSVAGYEPANALLAGDDGLDVIRRIARFVRCHLTKGGQAWIECDRAHAAAARSLFIAQGLRAEIRTDQYGKPRVIFVEK